VIALLRRDPHELGLSQSRWTLASLRQSCPDLAALSLSGIWRLLARRGFSWKRARQHCISPDPQYAEKLAWIADVLAATDHDSVHQVSLYEDELIFYRQPSLANAYEVRGPVQPRAQLSYQSNTATRWIATLQPQTGRVIHQRCPRLSIPHLVRFYQQLCAAYPDATTITLIQDNWPVHHHPDLLVALVPQQAPFAWPKPPTWPHQPSPAAVRRWGDWALPIQLAPLPTYAPWTNPVEKLWRWLKQEVLHLHRLADDLPALRTQVAAFLDQFVDGSDDLLRYTGLLVPH
jgi:hypothetical protein